MNIFYPKLILFVSLFFLTVSCSSTNNWRSYTKEEAKSELRNYYSEIVISYPEEYFKNTPEVKEVHLEPLRNFIQDRFDLETYISSSLSESDDYSISVDTAKTMGVYSVISAIEVYTALNLTHNETQLALFELDPEDSYWWAIPYVKNEVDNEDIDDWVKEQYDYQEGDRFFFFTSPDWWWDRLAGREGYLVMRESKLINIVITVLN